MKQGGRINVAYVPKGNATGGTIVPTAKLHAAGTLVHTGQGRDVDMMIVDSRCVVANGDMV